MSAQKKKEKERSRLYGTCFDLNQGQKESRSPTEREKRHTNIGSITMGEICLSWQTGDNPINTKRTEIFVDFRLALQCQWAL